MTAFPCINRKALALALALGAGCVAGAMPALADDQPGWLTKMLGLRTETPVSPEFVQKTRAPKTDYVPVHTPRVGPDSRPMSRDQVVAQEKSLDSSRSVHDKIAGRSVTKAEKSVADGPVDRKKKDNKQQDCGVLTCANPSLLPAQPGREYR
jgi:hypothetical protein